MCIRDSLQEAFRGVGNAITVQHALLAIVLGLQAVTKQSLNLSMLIQQSWESRLINSNSVVFLDGDFVFFAPVEHALRSFVTPQPPVTMSGEVEVSLAIPQCWCSSSVRVSGDTSLESVFRQCLKGPADLIRQIKVKESGKAEGSPSPVAKMVNMNKDKQVHINGVPIGSVSAHAISQETITSAAPIAEVIISPTAPFEAASLIDPEVPREIVIFDMPFEEIVLTKEFGIFLSAIERAQSGMITRPCQVKVLCPDVTTTLVAFVDVWQVTSFKLQLQHLTQAYQGKIFSVDNTATTGSSDHLVLQTLSLIHI